MEALAFAPPLTPEAAAKIESARAVLEEARRRARRAGQGFPLCPAGHRSRAPVPGKYPAHRVYRREGDVSPCVYLNVPNGGSGPKHRVFGNVRERDALDIWHDPAFADYRARILTECPPAGCAGLHKRFEQAG